MENIKINTTQNVALSYAAAGIGPRLLSVFLDTIFKYVYAFLIYILYIYVSDRGRYSGRSYYNDNNNEQLMIGIFIVLLLPFMLYHLLCETFMNGQSFGKKIINLKVVKLNGTQPNFGSYLVRSMFRLIDDSIIGLIAVAVSKNGQRLGDMVAGTTVIAMNTKISLKDTILNKQKANYTIVFNQVALLSDADANTIKEVLNFSREQEQPEHLALLAKKIKDKYGIANVSFSDERFLRTLLLDYSHYQFEH